MFPEGSCPRARIRTGFRALFTNRPYAPTARNSRMLSRTRLNSGLPDLADTTTAHTRLMLTVRRAPADLPPRRFVADSPLEEAVTSELGL
jgi:hypothetical protein